jgi:copper oxidase (laccase) domain-containing protein
VAPSAADGWQLRPRAGLRVLAWAAFDQLDLDALVTTRQGGTSRGPYESLNLGLHVADHDDEVIENRRRAATALGAELEDMVFCEQSHGREVRVVTAADRGRRTLRLDDTIADTDALVTTDPGVALVVMVADCVPVVLYDPVAHVLACVHGLARHGRPGERDGGRHDDQTRQQSG